MNTTPEPVTRWYVRPEARQGRFAERTDALIVWAVYTYRGRYPNGKPILGGRPTFFGSMPAARRYAYREARHLYGERVPA